MESPGSPPCNLLEYDFYFYFNFFFCGACILSLAKVVCGYLSPQAAEVHGRRKGKGLVIHILVT